MDWRSLLKILVVCALISGAVTSLLLLYPVNDAGHVAAWVQAFGSIAAIGGAYFVGREQARFAQKLVDEKKRQAIISIGSVARERADLVRSLLPQREEGQDWNCLSAIDIKLMTGYHASLSEGVVASIKNIPYHELWSAKSIVALQDIQSNFSFLDSEISTFLKKPSLIEVYSDAFYDLIPGSKDFIDTELALKNSFLITLYRRIEKIDEAYSRLVS